MQSNKVNNCSASTTDHRLLLFNLKKSSEIWFLSKRDYSDEMGDSQENYLQMQSSIKSILLDGFRHNSMDVYFNFSKFVNDLNWLYSTTTPSNAEKIIEEIPELNTADILSKWIYYNLKNCYLCARLQHLVSDAEMLCMYYYPSAFLCKEKYATALFICLSAIELNQSSLLSQVDSSLYEHKIAMPRHRRCNSHPDFSISPKKLPLMNNCTKDHVSIKDTYWNSKRSSKYGSNFKNIQKPSRLRRWKSLPNIMEHSTSKRTRSITISQPISIPRIRPNSNDFQKNPTFSNTSGSYSSGYNNTPGTSKSAEVNGLIPIQLVKCDNIQIHVDQRQQNDNRISSTPLENVIQYDSPPKPLSPINFLSCISNNLFSPSCEKEKYQKLSSSTFSTSSPNDFMSSFLPREGEKLKTRPSYSLFDDVDGFITSSSSLNIPNVGQSLASFLQSAQFSRNNTDLERENAHFNISEAIIAVIEHVKWTRVENRHQETKNKVCQQPANSFSHGQNSPEHKTNEDTFFSSEICDSREESTENLTDNSSCGDASEENLDNLRMSRNVLNDHTAYAEWGEKNLEASSAEGVALSLISKFSDKQLPKASDITWLVSEKDAPQKLLPMPGSFSVDTEENFIQSFTRGTRDWAPPRPQIIFTNHMAPNLKKLMQRQNYRCAGCGMRVSSNYMHRYRYCTYLGKYHCTGCHRNQISTIPAKVLEKWDFTYYPVSVFAYRLLEQIWTYPLFYMPDLNPQLYTKIKKLHVTKIKRLQLKYIRDFILTCRFASEEEHLLESIPTHWTADPDKWAMSDFVAVRAGTLKNTLNNLIEKLEEHVFSCVLCTARGFICEICPKKQIIYRWQIKVRRCDNCGTCFHQNCWKNIAEECRKCQRLRTREQQLVSSN